MIAQTRQQLDHVRMKRKKRHEDEASLNIAELNSLVRIWLELADENANDPVMKAHCHIRAYEYQEKIQVREQEHEHWLENLSKPKSTSATPVKPTTPTNQGHRLITPDAPSKSATIAPISAQALRSETRPSPTPSSRTNLRAANRKRAEGKRAEEAQTRAVARREKKAQIEAAKQAKMEERVALVRAEKERQRAKVQEQARLDAERIAKARAKVRAAPIGASDVQNSVIALKASQELSLSPAIFPRRAEVNHGSALHDRCHENIGTAMCTLFPFVKFLYLRAPTAERQKFQEELGTAPTAPEYIDYGITTGIRFELLDHEFDPTVSIQHYMEENMARSSLFMYE
ncbi:predicted protein [Pyrenophora tritici-repentis Pt-1C-BFP]|uniref:Uncharacterized protein n=3 Tax=Pyrenophora tritici-repentis TaxID=45151 RepID=B2VVL9_PYRTR|nr:uncharacterized protein PTRG_01231 [Pyrenophora tritici-repentis Pt-1C-BFP]EDU40669.1 predicted protein [Pyrenophora tritici-repentis Pt-1C-BFP]